MVTVTGKVSTGRLGGLQLEVTGRLIDIDGRLLFTRDSHLEGDLTAPFRVPASSEIL